MFKPSYIINQTHYHHRLRLCLYLYHLYFTINLLVYRLLPWARLYFLGSRPGPGQAVLAVVQGVTGLGAGQVIAAKLVAGVPRRSLLPLQGYSG